MSLDRYDYIPRRWPLRPSRSPHAACWAEKPTGTTDVMGRMRWDAPSLTIRTEFFKPEKGQYLHRSGTLTAEPASEPADHAPRGGVASDLPG